MRLGCVQSRTRRIAKSADTTNDYGAFKHHAARLVRTDHYRTPIVLIHHVRLLNQSVRDAGVNLAEIVHIEVVSVREGFVGHQTPNTFGIGMLIQPTRSAMRTAMVKYVPITPPPASVDARRASFRNSTCRRPGRDGSGRIRRAWQPLSCTGAWASRLRFGDGRASGRCPSLSRLLAITCSALTVAVSANVEIVACVLMPLRTVGFVAVSLSAIHVFTVRNGFQMGRIHAAGVVTQVIELEAIGDRTYLQFVGDTMGSILAAVASSETADSEPPVAMRIQTSHPRPAVVGNADDLLPEALSERARFRAVSHQTVTAEQSRQG